MRNNDSKPAAIPVGGIALLVVIVGGFLTAIGFALFGHHGSGPDKYRVLAITQGESQTVADIPSVGRVSLKGSFHKGPTTLVWLEAPTAFDKIGSPKVNLGSGDEGQVESLPTTSPNVLCVSVPPYYPPSLSQCDLKFWQQGTQIASFHLTNLLPSHANWSLGERQETIHAGPAVVQGRAWRTGFSVTLSDTQVAYELSAKVLKPVKGIWHLNCAPGQMANSPSGDPEIGENYLLGEGEARLVGTEANLQRNTFAPYKTYQAAVRVHGTFARLEPTEEVIDLPFQTAQNIPTGGQVLVGEEGSKAVESRSGIRFTIRKMPLDSQEKMSQGFPTSFGGVPKPRTNIPSPVQFTCRITYPNFPKGTVVRFLDPKTKKPFFVSSFSGEAQRHGDETVLNGMTDVPLPKDHPHQKILISVEREVESYPFTLTLPISDMRGPWPSTPSHKS